jgi:hypothetical protein
MKADIEQIALSIKGRRAQEMNANVTYPAFGRSDGRLNNNEQTFWIVLSQSKVGGILQNSGKDFSVSRDAPLGAILIQNHEGGHTYTVRGKFKDEVYKNTINIYNRAKYVPSYDENVLASDIVINISGDKNMYLFRNLFEFINKLTSVNQQIKKTQEELEKVITEQKKKDADDLHKKLEKEIQRQQNFITNAQKFIRQSAELRWQPILDPWQDAIKREKIFDGGTLIIDGGPGTGKTTSLIQRIKFLISNTIEEYRPLTAKQREILYNQKTSWIFFSPNKLLALFLKDSMTKEGLAASDNTVKVWAKHREEIIRLYGWVEKESRVFKFYEPNDAQRENSLFINQGSILDIAQDFEKYFLERHREKLQDKFKDSSYQAANNIVTIETFLQIYSNIEVEKRRKIVMKIKRLMMMQYSIEFYRVY